MSDANNGVRGLRAWMKKHQRNQVWLSDKLDCSQGTVSAWLRNESVPSLGLAFALEDLTGVAAKSWNEPTDEHEADSKKGAA